MSRSTNDPTTSQESRRSTPVPRAVIHKQILDAAVDRPDASMSELADDVNGASVDLVEQVLEEYGDPAADDPSADDPETDADSRDSPDADPESRDERDEDPKSEDSEERNPESSDAGEAASPNLAEPDSATDGGVTIDADREPTGSDRTTLTDAVGRIDSASDLAIDPDSLSETKRRTLLAIRDRPNATQQELADSFDVTAATINRRVNDIDGFEWSNRQAIVAELFPADRPAERDPDVDPTDSEPDGGSTEPVPDEEPAEPVPEDEPAEPVPEDEPSQREPDDESAMPDSDGGATRRDGQESAGTEPDGDTRKRDTEADPTQRESADSTNPEPNADPSGSGSDDPKLEVLTSRVDSLTESVEALERRLDSSGGRRRPGIADPELIAKAMHACLQSDRISEAEELRLLERFMADD